MGQVRYGERRGQEDQGEETPYSSRTRWVCCSIIHPVNPT